ncbi:MAG TPA: aldehyde ferredoxin oxidoreductase family protein [Candidatus Limnocylindrales bacterium]|nr:aldehyde ferredoxin oxidoreductase family protein [Candidatus Limnocylindrales bacterium]
MKGGYVNRILWVDLSNKEFHCSELSESYAREFISGRGLGVKTLYDELPAKVDPLSPQNILVISNGVLTGTSSPFCARSWIVTKSPLTGAILMSNSGGFFGPELKFAGYDMVVVKGKAKKFSYLWINNDKVELRDASKLRGLGTQATQDKIARETDPKTRAACIGPAGEKLVKFSSIMCADRAFGRGGSGAVFASKNLKAIAVRGTMPVPVAEPETFRTVIKQVLETYARNDFMQEWRKVGTVFNVGAMNELGIFPTRNFQTGFFEGYQQLDDKANKQYVEKHITCYGCPVACTSWSVVRTGEFAGAKCRGPEYETIWAFGGSCGNDRLDSIIAANAFCNEMGLDTESTGQVIGFAMELFERGIITEKDTGGIPLHFGDFRSMLKLADMIATRQGLGDVLAEGVRYASGKIGKDAPRYAIHVKGLEIDGYDPRGAKAQGLAYATASRGGCHHSGYASQELYDPKFDRFTEAGKGAITKGNEDSTALVDSTGICAFPMQLGVLTIKELGMLLYAATGFKEFSDEQNLAMIGERIYNQERLFNVREGLNSKDDVLPMRFLTEPTPTGNSKGSVVQFWDMRKEYYSIRGWSQEGVPKAGKLAELKLRKK